MRTGLRLFAGSTPDLVHGCGLWHGTTQDDDLLAKDGVFDKEGGVGSEGRTQRAHDGFEDFDEHRGAKPSTGRSADKSWRKLRPVRLGTEFLRRTGISVKAKGALLFPIHQSCGVASWG
jgi:hypothetical protein